jgi:hypothetical protein
MSDPITRNTPVYFDPRRISLEEEDGVVTATADFWLRNASGAIIDDDHPSITMTSGEQATFLAWVLGKFSLYETATGLTRWTGD